MISIIIDGKVKASALCMIYNNVYTFLQGGNDIDIPNLAKFLVYQVINDASNRADILDLMSDDCGWKEHWRLDKTLLYNISNKN